MESIPCWTWQCNPKAGAVVQHGSRMHVCWERFWEDIRMIWGSCVYAFDKLNPLNSLSIINKCCCHSYQDFCQVKAFCLCLQKSVLARGTPNHPRAPPLQTFRATLFLGLIWWAKISPRIHIFQSELTQKSYSSATIVHTEIICSVYICAIHRHIIQVQSAQG